MYFNSCFSSCLSAFTKPDTLKQLGDVTWHFGFLSHTISQIKNKDLCIEAPGSFLADELSSLQTERLPGASTHILVASHIPKRKNTCGTKDVPVTERTLLLSPVLYLLIGASALLFLALTEHSKPFHRMFVCSRHIFFFFLPPPPCFSLHLFEMPNFCNSKPKQPDGNHCGEASVWICEGSSAVLPTGWQVTVNTLQGLEPPASKSCLKCHRRAGDSIVDNSPHNRWRTQRQTVISGRA